MSVTRIYHASWILCGVLFIGGFVVGGELGSPATLVFGMVGGVGVEAPTAAEAPRRRALRDRVQHLRRAGRGGGDDSISKLERLANLHDRGVLIDDELAAQKRNMLGDG